MYIINCRMEYVSRQWDFHWFNSWKKNLSNNLTMKYVHWLVHIVVLPMGLNSSSSLGPFSSASIGTLCSVQWLPESTHLCNCQVLAEPLRRQLYLALVSKHLLASTIVYGFGNYIWNGSPDGTVSGWPLLQSLLHTLSYLLLWVFSPRF